MMTEMQHQHLKYRPDLPGVLSAITPQQHPSRMGDSNFSRGFEEILDNTESEIGDAIHQAMDLMAGVLREEGLQFGVEADHVRVVPELEEAFRDRPSIASSIMVSWFWVVQINESVQKTKEYIVITV